jgi:hypothetical protein
LLAVPLAGGRLQAAGGADIHARQRPRARLSDLSVGHADPRSEDLEVDISRNGPGHQRIQVGIAELLPPLRRDGFGG